MESVHSISGNSYLIDIENNEIKTIYVMDNGQKRIVSRDELNRIITLLNEKLNNYYTKEKTDKLNIDSILAFLKTKIDANEFKTLADINKYLDSLDLQTNERDSIIKDLNEFMKDKFQINNKEYNDQFNKFKENLHKKRDKNETFFSSIEVSNGVATHKMYTFDSVTRKLTEIDKKSFDYTEGFKQDFLSVMAKEFAKDSPLTSSTVTPRGFLEADFELTNKNNAVLKYSNIERAYAYDIQKETNETKNLSQEEVIANQEKENNYQNGNPENQLDSDLQRFDGLTEQEKNALQQEKGYTRVRKLEKNNSGKIGRAYVLVCILIAFLLLAFVTIQIFS